MNRVQEPPLIHNRPNVSALPLDRPRLARISAIMAVILLCAALVLSTSAAFMAFAEGPTQTFVTTQGEEVTVPVPEPAVTDTTQGQDAQPQDDGAAAAVTEPADDCTITLNYYEIVNYEDPDVDYDENRTRLMGTRTLSGFHEGQTVSAWDYVVDIPGYFFWDGWPNKMTVSKDPSQNVFTLNYMRLWNSEYTVNYYVMTGADLTAGTWADALATDDVTFTKMGSEVFTNQRFDKLIKGDAYEYKLNDMYVIDTYPAEIRLGTDPDNNVINVLYTPDITTLPDDLEIPDGIFNYDDLITTLPDSVEIPDNIFDYNDIIATLPDSVEIPDGIFNFDDQVTTLPDAVEVPDGTNYDDQITNLPDNVLVEDFVGSGDENADGDTTVEITDEMLDNPVPKADAEATINAYRTGIEDGKTVAKTGDATFIAVSVLAGVALVAAVVFAIIAWRNRKRPSEEDAA